MAGTDCVYVLRLLILKTTLCQTLQFPDEEGEAARRVTTPGHRATKRRSQELNPGMSDFEALSGVQDC